jgi:malonyl-CoA O-methyltransferase
MNASNHSSDLRDRDVRRRFDRAADSFDEADFVQRVTRDGLLERLRPMAAEAAIVLDLGAATGSTIPLLQKRFRRARVIAVDSSPRMLQLARRKRTLLSKRHAVLGDARALPFADACVDVVFSNLMLPWLGRPDPVFAEVARVLRMDGLFAFSTLGPDSLLEIREAWGPVDGDAHVGRFPDMHDVGDALVRAGLRDPVLDVDRLSISYRSSAALFRDLTSVGARNSLHQRQPGLTGRNRLRSFVSNLFGAGGQCTLTLELVYGHCWGGGARRADGEITVDATQIPLRRQ